MPDRTENSRQGQHTVGDVREFHVVWTPDGWEWRGIGAGTNAYWGGSFDTSELAYRDALRVLG